MRPAAPTCEPFGPIPDGRPVGHRRPKAPAGSGAEVLTRVAADDPQIKAADGRDHCESAFPHPAAGAGVR